MCTNVGSQSEEHSEDLMPCIMGIFDSILEEEKHQTITDQSSENFTHLSQGVQRLLSHIPQHKIRVRLSPEKKTHSKCCTGSSANEKTVSALNRSTESLDIISPAVQKMLSNLPDTELVISSNQFNKKTNRSFLHSGSETHLNRNSDNNNCKCEGDNDIVLNEDVKNTASVNSNEDNKPVPLGSYLHTSPQGVASRIHIESKSPKKYSQSSTEGRLGVCNNISSNEVSRPVSLSSIGSYSSLESSGNNQLGYTHLLSAESLDSDPEPSGSQGSADSGIAEQSSSITAEMRVLQEILESESKYVSDLEEIIQGYLRPWRLEPGCSLAPYLDGLFGNIEEIYEFNRKILEFLNEAEGDSIKTANVFLQNHSGFAVYTEYCTNYPHTMHIISELTRNEELVPIFREKQLALGHALPLATYLLKPVQRILKYHLLLQRLSKQCEPEQHVVDLALATMTGIASDINLMKRKHEHAVRVQELQSQLYEWTGPELTALGELIAEGTFRVAGARGRRHVLLFDKLFLMTKSKQNGTLYYKFHIMCSNLMLVEQVRGDPLSFQVLPFDNPRLQCTLRARSPQHKREWTLQIKRVILENYSAIIPNHARKLVMQLGENVNEIDETPEKWVPIKDNTPHYLERRSRVRKTMDWRRKSEPGNFLQYKSKTLPHKSKLKKQKGASTFYTDLSDSENFGSTNESTNNLLIDDAKTSSSSHDLAHSSDAPKMDLEQIVSDIVKEEFEKLKRTKRSGSSHEGPQGSPSSKSDSLPRSFQLNEQSSNGGYNNTDLNASSEIGSSNSIVNADLNDTTSDSETSDHPYHKIYRRSLIRVSFLQRIRALMPEQQRKTNHQIWSNHNFKNSKEHLSHPESTEQTPTVLNTPVKSQSHDEEKDGIQDSLCERDELDVRNEFQELEISNDTGQNTAANSSSSHTNETNSSCNCDSSQNDNSNNENLPNKNTTAEYIENAYYPNSAVNNTFEETLHANEVNNVANTIKYFESTHVESKVYERNLIPENLNKIGPPVPVKPSHLSVRDNRKSFNGEPTNSKNNNESSPDQENNICDNDTQSEYFREFTTKSWVKAMIGRFE